MANYKLTLNLPQSLKNVEQRVLEGHSDVVVTRSEGYVGPLTSEQLKIAEKDAYIKVEELKSAPKEGKAPIQARPSKAELLKKASELKIDVPKGAKVADIEKLISEAASSTKDEESDEVVDDETEVKSVSSEPETKTKEPAANTDMTKNAAEQTAVNE